MGLSQVNEQTEAALNSAKTDRGRVVKVHLGESVLLLADDNELRNRTVDLEDRIWL